MIMDLEDIIGTNPAIAFSELDFHFGQDLQSFIKEKCVRLNEDVLVSRDLFNKWLQKLRTDWISYKAYTSWVPEEKWTTDFKISEQLNGLSIEILYTLKVLLEKYPKH